MQQPLNTQTQWARLLVESLAAGGVEHFVVSPGARSTPLVAALQDCAAVAGLTALRSTIVIDERAAGFVALGHARATGRVSALVCTSGSAPAHYLPAVIEAAASGVPLLVLSADRPLDLQANGSPQTINQHRLFGTHCRAFFDLGAPLAVPDALRGLQRKVAQALAATRYPTPGPVHLNVPAFKPLEPQPATTPVEQQLEQHVSALLTRGLCTFEAPNLAPTAATLQRLETIWSQAQRPALFLGPSLPTAEVEGILRFAAHARWPVLAEVTHPLRASNRIPAVSRCDDFELVARGGAPGLMPDLVVSVGATATSRAWLSLVGEHAPMLHVVSPHVWTDCHNRAQTLVAADPNLLFHELALRVRPASPAWVNGWSRASRRARDIVERFLSEPNTVGPTERAHRNEEPRRARPSACTFIEGHVLHQLSSHVQTGDAVVLGNSLSIRLAETFLRPSVPYQCICQRGANGIDGLVAGSVGASLANPQRRTWLIVGDVSLVHDLGALQIMADTQPNLVVCVLDNDGGRIFDELPIVTSGVDMQPWTTRHSTDVAGVAAAFGLCAQQVDRPSQLQQALKDLRTGPAVIVCRVHPTGARECYAKLVSATAAELAQLPNSP